MSNQTPHHPETQASLGWQRKPAPRWPFWLGIVGLHVWLLHSDLLSVAPGHAQAVVAALLLAQEPQPTPKTAPPKPRPKTTTEPERVAQAQPAVPEPTTPNAAEPQSPPADVSTPMPTNAVAAAALPAQPSSTAVAAPLQLGLPWPVTYIPASMRIQFALSGTVKGASYGGDSELVWRNLGDKYDMALEFKVLFTSTKSTSTGLLQASAGTGLVPMRYSNRRPLSSERAAHLQREQGRIVFSANTPSAELHPAAQDRLSVFMQLCALAASAPERLQSGLRISLQIVDVTDAENWTFIVHGREKMDTEQGELDTIKLSRAPRKAFDSQVDVWLAPSLGYLPAHMRITQSNGDVIDQVLRSVEN